MILNFLSKNNPSRLYPKSINIVSLEEIVNFIFFGTIKELLSYTFEKISELTVKFPSPFKTRMM